jgi:uncharacterized membrane protein
MNPETFYALKTAAFLASTVLLVFHMSRAWDETSGWGQRLRYLALLYFATLFTVISVKQTRAHTTIQWFNVGVMGGAVLLIVAMVVSLVERRRKP